MSVACSLNSEVLAMSIKVLQDNLAGSAVEWLCACGACPTGTSYLQRSGEAGIESDEKGDGLWRWNTKC
jgi:hypothetical protein